jgi:hypothetical protein
MARKTPKSPPDDPEEYKRFLDTAKEVGAENDPKAFERAFKTVVPPKKAS